MKIAVIGAGNVGGALGKGWAAKGHAIYFGVNNEGDDKYKPLLSALGNKASFHTPKEAASQADIVVLATPWAATEEAVKSTGNNLSGKLVIDCTNPLTQDFGLAVGYTTSAGEEVQRWAKGAKIYKSFNTVGFNIMENPVIDGRRAVMFFCGDDQAYRNKVKQLVEDIGFEAIDAGPLKTARLLEPYGLLWIQSAYKFGQGRDFAFSLVRR